VCRAASSGVHGGGRAAAAAGDGGGGADPGRRGAPARVARAAVHPGPHGARRARAAARGPRPRAHASLFVSERPGSSTAVGRRRGVRQQAGRDVRGGGAGRGAGRGRPRARRAVGRLRLGRRAHAAGSPRAPALRLPWRVRTVIYNHQPRARCAAAQVRNRADAGCSVEASLACHAASVPPGVERPLLDADVLASGVLSGTSRVAGRAWCVWGPPA